MTRRLNDRLLLAALAVAVFGLNSCYYDDDDCHTHYSNGVYIRHCHDDDDFYDDDDYYYYLRGDSVNGEVSVLVTDSPSDEVQALYVTVTEISLHGDESERQLLYRSSEGERFDLLSLRGTGDSRFFELLANRVTVTPGTYHTLRLSIRDPRLVLRSGEVVPEDEIDLAAAGKLGIGLSEPLVLAPADLVFLVLDFDVELSLARETSAPPADETPGKGTPHRRWRFEPLVLVDAHREKVADSVATPIDLDGKVHDIEPEADGLTLELSPGGGFVQVTLLEETTVIGTDIEPTIWEAIRKGREIAVRGTLLSEGGLEALSVKVGPTFEVSGTLREVQPSAEGVVVRLADDSGKVHEVEALNETLFSSGRLEEATAKALEVGREVAILAQEASGDAVAGALEIDVEPAAEEETQPRPAAEASPRALDAEARFPARITAVDPVGRTIRVGSGGEEFEIEVPREVSIVMLEELNGRLWEQPLLLEDVEVGMVARRFRSRDDGYGGPVLVLARGEDGVGDSP